MTTIQVSVQRDHLHRLANTSPLLGVVELIWNALDAEADTITVELLRNELGGVDGVIVSDDGHGMTYEEAVEEFGKLGGSWKSGSNRTRTGERELHGEKGEGRFRAFSLGLQ